MGLCDMNKIFVCWETPKYYHANDQEQIDRPTENSKQFLLYE